MDGQHTLHLWLSIRGMTSGWSLLDMKSRMSERGSGTVPKTTRSRAALNGVVRLMLKSKQHLNM